MRDEHELVDHAAQQRPVVGDHHEPALEALERVGERRAHVDVQVVRRLVEQQQVRPRVHHEREREPRALPARERADALVHAVPGEAEAAEEGARARLVEPGVGLAQRLVGGRRRVQALDLVLGEVARCGASPPARGCPRAAPAPRRSS